MHDLPRQKLSELLTKHGPTLCDDAKKLEGLLKDALRNEHKRETFVLISSLREGVAYELRSSTSRMPVAALATKLTRQLCDNLALDEAAAHWCVESWALALGIEITSLQAAPTKQAKKVSSTEPTPAAGTGVDLAAIALQHRANAEQEQVQFIQGKAAAVLVENEAKALVEQSRDFAGAARMIQEIEPQWRDAKLYKKICGDRDRAAVLDAGIQRAVQKGRLRFLRSRIQELLNLLPQRDDMRRLLEVLPEEPELSREFTNSINMKFLLIQPGEFMMGSNEFESEKPPHVVEITQPFYLGVFPVSQAEYEAFIGTNPSTFSGNGQRPVEQVDWQDAVAFCEKLSQLTVEVQRGASYRLPTEAEWEYACRAGSTGKWCFGDQESQLGDYAWFAGNSANRTHPVGEKKPNAWDLHDMHGNVWEWCQDRYCAEAYKGRSGISQDPFVKSGSNRVFRGGSWIYDSAGCRSAFRNSYDPTGRTSSSGFRLALSSVK